MKRKVRTALSLLLTCAMAAALLPTFTLPANAEWNNPFRDVKPTDWFYADVEYAHTNKLMSGTSTNKFSPNTPLTRGMAVTILYRLAGEPNIDRIYNQFIDVPLHQWYANAVEWGVTNKIITGVNYWEFRPNTNITRQDFAVMLRRYTMIPGWALSRTDKNAAFSDESSIADYAKDTVQYFYRAGVLSGKPGNRIDPRGNTTRAEATAMLHRFITKAYKPDDDVFNVKINYGPFYYGHDGFIIGTTREIDFAGLSLSDLKIKRIPSDASILYKVQEINNIVKAFFLVEYIKSIQPNYYFTLC